MGATEHSEAASAGRGDGEHSGRDVPARGAEDYRLAPLFECLAGLGRPGRRAREFLETARWLLGADDPGVACQGEAVAYCVRQAMDFILESAGTSADDNRWNDLSRRVVDAKNRFERAGRLGEAGDPETALSDLLAAIRALEEFHDGAETRSERQAADVIAKLTGSHALRGGLAPIKEFLQTRKQSNRLLHRSCSVEEAERLLYRCFDAMLVVLRSPANKGGELAARAGKASPDEADLEAALGLIASEADIEVFLDSAADPAWLELLYGSGRLDPIEGSRSWQAARRATARLSASHTQRVTAWLNGVADDHSGDHDRCAAVAGALLNLENPEFQLALSIAARHPNSDSILVHFRRALVDTDPRSSIVEECADALLGDPASDAGQGPQTARYVQRPYTHRQASLLRIVCEGADETNAERRIRLLVGKMAGRPFLDVGFGVLNVGGDPRLPISCLDDGDPWWSHRGPHHALAGCLVRVLGKAMDWLPSADLLGLVEAAPAELAARLRPWILAAAADANPEAMISEVETAIGSRRPTCDDVALIDRIACTVGTDDPAGRWRAAMGEPPTVIEASRALAAGGLLPDRWRFPYFWFVLLPEAASGAWTDAPGLRVLEARFGPPDDRGIYLALQSAPDSSARAMPVRSPLSAEHLRSLGPERAVDEIASWRPQSGDWTHSCQLIADTLEQLVGEDPAGWLADPLAVAVRLRHPTYITGYLRGAAKVADNHADFRPIFPVGELVDVMTMVQAEPWSAEQLAPADRLDDHFEPNWTQARQAGTDLAKALIESGAGLGGRDDDVWDYLEAEARTNPDTYDAADSGQNSGGDPVERMLDAGVESNSVDDPLFLAINQANTRAVDAALALMAQEYKEDMTVRPQAVKLIEWCLHQPGLPGATFRGIIAPAVLLLHHILPDWFEANRELLFGNEAPGRLGQLTVDVAVNWSQPWDWLLDNCADSIYDSAGRGVEQSFRWLMLAMLHQVGGYEPHRIARHLGGRVEQACGELADLIERLDGITSDQMEAITSFCDAVIEHENGRYAPALGRLAYADSLDHRTWAALTLKALDATGGRIGHSHQIAERILDNTPVPDSAAIFFHLVEVQTNQALTAANSVEGQYPDHHDGAWTRGLIADKAADWLNTATNRHPGDEYHQLERKLRDHGLWNPGSPSLEQ